MKFIVLAASITLMLNSVPNEYIVCTCTLYIDMACKIGASVHIKCRYVCLFLKHINLKSLCYYLCILSPYVQDVPFNLCISSYRLQIRTLSHCISYLIQNSQAVKKVCGPQKGYGEKRCEIQGGGQEMAVIVG